MLAKSRETQQQLPKCRDSIRVPIGAPEKIGVEPHHDPLPCYSSKLFSPPTELSFSEGESELARSQGTRRVEVRHSFNILVFSSEFNYGNAPEEDF